MNSIKYFQDTRYWLLAIATGIIAIHLTLVWRSDNIDVIGTSLLFWMAAGLLIWERKDDLNLESGPIATGLGIILVALVLLRSVSISGYDIFLRVSPVISTVGLGLIASGLKGIKQYWQELLIVGFIAIPPGFMLSMIDISPLTAKFTHFMMWYLGFQITREGTHLIIPPASLEVASGCSGMTIILQLLGLSLLVLIMFPSTAFQKILIPMSGIAIAFVVNGVRVALMTYLLAFSGKQDFEYWHYGDGSLIFSMIAVAIFGLFCWFTVLRDDPENQKAGE